MGDGLRMGTIPTMQRGLRQGDIALLMDRSRGSWRRVGRAPALRRPAAVFRALKGLSAGRGNYDRGRGGAEIVRQGRQVARECSRGSVAEDRLD